MQVIVNIQLKQGVLDPQGKAALHALGSIGFDGVSDVRIGKQIILNINNENKDEARDIATNMCEQLLANTVIEDYKIEL